MKHTSRQAITKSDNRRLGLGPNPEPGSWQHTTTHRIGWRDQCIGQLVSLLDNSLVAVQDEGHTVVQSSHELACCLPDCLWLLQVLKDSREAAQTANAALVTACVTALGIAPACMHAAQHGAGCSVHGSSCWQLWPAPGHRAASSAHDMINVGLPQPCRGLKVPTRKGAATCMTEQGFSVAAS